MKRIRSVTIVIIAILLLGNTTYAAEIFRENGAYNSNEGELWGVTQDRIDKIYSPGQVYDCCDIDENSAYITNSAELTGNNIESSLFWYNHSRLAYVKLINVANIKSISMVFEKSIYIFCAQYDKNFKLVDYGSWHTIGERINMVCNAEWIMVVFRQDNGCTAVGSGQNLYISPEDLKSIQYKYLVFSPFTYRFDLNGGNYNLQSGVINMERLGVEKIALPEPKKDGYIFGGWKSEDGSVYCGELPAEYNENLFCNVRFTAIWTPIRAERVSLSQENVVLEQNINDSIELNAVITPSDAIDKVVTWKSDNEDVAIVDSNGKVTARTTGKAVITATTPNNISASCEVYVMGFEITVPATCALRDTYEISVNIYNNGKSGMSNRKRILIDTDNKVSLVRDGDSSTICTAKTEYAGSNGCYKFLEDGEYLANTEETTTIQYRLIPNTEIKKAGDYKGNVNFTVSVK